MQADMYAYVCMYFTLLAYGPEKYPCHIAHASLDAYFSLQLDTTGLHLEVKTYFILHASKQICPQFSICLLHCTATVVYI